MQHKHLLAAALSLREKGFFKFSHIE